MNELSLNPSNYIFNDLFLLISILFLVFLPFGVIIRTYGISREKFSISSLIILFLSLPVIIITSYLFGWAISFAFSNGPGITGSFSSFYFSLPWNSNMGPTLNLNSDLLSYKITPLKFITFVIFSWSIVLFLGSSLLERIRIGAFLILVIILGSVFWPIALSWSWSNSGWMSKIFGYHDAFGSGAFHTLLGGFALGVLSQISSRLGKFNDFQKPRTFPINSSFHTIIGNFLIMFGLLGLFLSSLLISFDIKNETGVYMNALNIFGTPISLSGSMFNLFLALSGGMIISSILKFRNSQFMFSGGIIGIISVSSGADYYFPLQSFIIAMIVTFITLKSYVYIEERYRIDDKSAIITTHGFAGFWGLIISGILLWGYPSSSHENSVFINPFGQFAGALILFWILGFIPGYLSAKILKFFNILEISSTVQIAGQDITFTRDKYLNNQELIEAENEIISNLKRTKNE